MTYGSYISTAHRLWRFQLLQSNGSLTLLPGSLCLNQSSVEVTVAEAAYRHCV